MTTHNGSLIECRHTLATAEMRALSEDAQAAALYVDHNFSLRVISEALGISVKKVRTRVSNFKKGKDTSKAGRPKMLTEVEEDELKQWILEWEKAGKAVKFPEFKTKVNFFQHHFYLLSTE